MQNLSVVHIIEDSNVSNINTLAEILGKGSDNLSIKLKDSSNKIYWGCHSWWTKEAYIQFKDHDLLSSMGIDLTIFEDSLNKLIEGVVDSEMYENFSPLEDNWNKTLTKYGLVLYEEVG